MRPPIPWKDYAAMVRPHEPVPIPLEKPRKCQRHPRYKKPSETRELFDVIDEDIAARMLDQHDRYSFGRIALQRSALNPELWYVYWGQKEAHTVLGEECDPFASLAAALEWALSPRNHERLEEMHRQ